MIGEDKVIHFAGKWEGKPGSYIICTGARGEGVGDNCLLAAIKGEDGAGRIAS